MDGGILKCSFNL